jgi:CheY-like chemotaxis protein/HPt (histidine-containing phosphotransfer) domain-containing protein
LAEDNIVNQQVAQGILKKLGLRADVVANGIEALKALEQIPYDLILMDVQMPELNGLEATRIIRGQNSSLPYTSKPVFYPDLPIIAMTAYSMHGDMERCLAAGMNGYISKPVSAQAVLDTLDKWLPREQNAPDTSSPMITAIPPSSLNAGSIVPPSPTHQDVPPAFDSAGMLARLLQSEELVRTIVSGFIADIPNQIGALKGFLNNEDCKGLQRQAHTLKGTAANAGGEQLRGKAFELEKASKNSNLKLSRELISEIEHHFYALKVEMEKWLKEHPETGNG